MKILQSTFFYFSIIFFLLKPSLGKAQTYSATTDCGVTLSVAFDFTTCLCPDDTAYYSISITDAASVLDSLDIEFVSLHGDSSLMVNVLNTSPDFYEVALPNGIPDHFILDFVFTQDTCEDTISIYTDIYSHFCPTLTTNTSQNLFFQNDSDASASITSSTNNGYWYYDNSTDIFDDGVLSVSSSDSATNLFIDSLVVGLNTLYFHYNIHDSLLCSTAFMDSTVSIYLEKPLIARISNDTICINSAPMIIDTLLQDPSFTFGLTGDGVVAGSFFPSLAGIGAHDLILSIYNADSTSIIYDTMSVVVLDTPSISFSIAQDFIFSGSTITLAATPAGGAFSGNNVSGNSFSADLTSLGNQFLTYTYTDTLTGCTSLVQDSILVLQNLQSLIDTSFCDYETTYTLPLHTTHIYGIGVSSDESILYLDSISSGTYIYQEIFDSSSNTLLSDSFQIIIHTTNSADFMQDSLELCYGASVSLFDYTTFNLGTFSGAGVTGASFLSTGLAAGDYPVIHTTTNAQCTRVDTLMIVVHALPVADLSSIDREFCQSDSAYLMPVIPDLYEYNEAGAPFAYFDVPNRNVGTHDILVYMKNEYDCTSDSIFSMEIHALPVTTYTQKDTLICSGAEAIIDIQKAEGSTYNFNPITLFADTTGTIQGLTLTQSTEIMVLETNLHNCKNWDTIRIQVENCFDGDIVGVFSPNGDGQNDTWVIRGLDGLSNYVEVYNRWGELLVSFFNYRNNWKGNTENGDLPDGVYYYQIRVDGYSKPFTGTITIVR